LPDGPPVVTLIRDADRRRSPWLALLLATLVACIACSVLLSAVSYVEADSKGALLLSQTSAQDGTVRLDAVPNVLPEYGYRVRKKNDHIYYYFPMGASLYSVPFVAVANFLGQDMRFRYDENRMQLVMAAFLGVVTFLLLYRIATSLAVEAGRSVALAALFWFGTSYCSTSGTAFFSHNWASVTSLLAFLLVVRAGETGANPRWFLIGFFLFSAYLCRPTLALLSPVMILFLWTFNRGAAVKVALVILVLLALFVTWSFHEFGQPLPDYYLPKRLTGSRFGEALLGNLVSPSRGLFVYMPFLLVPFIFWRHSVSVIAGAKRTLIVLAWPLIHLFSVSEFPHWWGGYSYGPRLMLDVIPAFFFFFCLFARDLPRGAWALRWILVTGLLAIYINWFQGLFNVYTYQWNVQPGVDRVPATVWDWRYPQFLHSEARHNQREREFQLTDLQPVSPGESLGFENPGLAFVGWHEPWQTLRWSRGAASEIYFRLDPADTYRGELRLRAGYLGHQRVTVFLNGSQIAAFDGSGPAPTGQVIRFDPALLTFVAVNVIRFQFSDAGQPGRGQHFHLAMALEDVVLN